MKYFSKIHNSEMFIGLPYWIAAVITGILSYIYAKIFIYAEHKFLQLIDTNTNYAFIICPIGFFIAWFLVYKFSPAAGGSGIPQVLAAIEISHEKDTNKELVRKLISFPTALIKILSTFIVALSGGALGREGPTIQISAYIFHSIGYRFKNSWQSSRQDIYLITGGAAGIAAAFNTPLGGIVYAIEELSKSTFHKFRTSLFSAVIISGITAQILSGPYLFIGSPTLYALSSKHLPFSILIGVATGITGALFGKLLFLISIYRSKIKNISSLAIVAILAGTLLAVLINFVDIEAAGSGRTIIKKLLFSDHQITLDQILVRFFSPIISYSSGAAGGIFAPSLSIGATIGAVISNIFESPYTNTFIILGMIGFLSGFTGAPFTSFMIVLEMTDKHSIVLSMMITSIVASVVSQIIDKNTFYEKMKNQYILKLKT